LEVNLAETLPKLRGNARQLEDLWVNLLLLARDAANDGFPHTVRVACYAGPERSLVVEVQDDGAPIPSELLGVAFEPDFVGSTIGRGAGMELSICREIVRQHGGEISVASGPEHDTIFRINFPLEG
jgi:signal transduction histidine kinase